MSKSPPPVGDVFAPLLRQSSGAAPSKKRKARNESQIRRSLARIEPFQAVAAALEALAADDEAEHLCYLVDEETKGLVALAQGMSREEFERQLGDSAIASLVKRAQGAALAYLCASGRHAWAALFPVVQLQSAYDCRYLLSDRADSIRVYAYEPGFHLLELLAGLYELREGLLDLRDSLEDDDAPDPPRVTDISKAVKASLQSVAAINFAVQLTREAVAAGVAELGRLKNSGEKSSRRAAERRAGISDDRLREMAQKIINGAPSQNKARAAVAREIVAELTANNSGGNGGEVPSERVVSKAISDLFPKQRRGRPSKEASPAARTATKAAATKK